MSNSFFLGRRLYELTLYYRGPLPGYVGNIVDHAIRIFNKQYGDINIRSSQQGEWYTIEKGNRFVVDVEEMIDGLCHFFSSFGDERIVCHVEWRPGVGDFLICEKMNK